MEEGNKKVRQLKDESELPYMTEQFIQRVFQDLIPRNKRLKIKNKDKFHHNVSPAQSKVYHDYLNEALGENKQFFLPYSHQ